MQLVIAEKPSVARDLARVLGVRASGQGSFEGDAHVITWCIGHLVELDEPAAYDERWKAWRLDTLPMLPAELRLRPASHARDQLRVVTRLLRDRRFASVVNACDAGREGELIFRYAYQFAGGGPPVWRLWISSLTDEAIRRGFASLQPGARFDALADAARSRSEADWLVGMNATRAVTVRGRDRGRGDGAEKAPLASIGRVQTPTLAMLVARELAIRAFVPRDYWEVRADLRTLGGERFAATWRAGKVSRLGTAAIAEAIAGRDRAHAAAGGARLPCVERLRARTVREPPPPLFDLTSLQRTANRRFGWSAARTLELAQALYERHKVLTYPRTDSRHLPEDLVGELPALIDALGGIDEYAAFAAELRGRPLAIGKRVVDDTKVHDHHAIIPTGTAARGLDRDEARMFDLVARRFLGVFFPDAEIAVTEVWIRVGVAVAGSPAPAWPEEQRASAAGGEAEADVPILDAVPPEPDRYFARGRVRVVAGWQAVAGIDGGDDREGRRGDAPGVLPVLAEGQALGGTFAPVAKKTTPPARYTEATLLGAMESAGKTIDDEALRAAMKERGLGTPATRAAIIETLLRRKYVERAAKALVATESGIGLIRQIEAMPGASLASPELTGAWEARLARIARGEEPRAGFMADIARYVRDFVDAVRGSPAPPRTPPALPRATLPVAATPGTRTGTATGTGTATAAVAAGKRKQSTATATAPALGADTRLACPRCTRGTLITGARGWGCGRWRDGCRFVIWFETAGRRLTAAQLRDLVTRGRTRKARFVGRQGAAIAGSLVLDPALDGGARLDPS